MSQRLALLLAVIIVPHILHTKAIATRKGNKKQQQALLIAKIKKLQGEMGKETRTKEKAELQKRIVALRASLNQIKL